MVRTSKMKSYQSGRVKKMAKTKITVSIDKPVDKILIKESEKQDRSKSQIVNRALKQHLNIKGE